MPVTMEQIKQLREKTNAGFMDCKDALNQANGDMEKAIDELRKKGLATASRRAGKSTKEGLVESYIHMGGKIGVMLEVNCETDFVARNDKFKEFVRDIAMHIAASNPQYLNAQQVPTEVIEREKEIFKAQAGDKPANVLEKMLEGKIKKFYADVCLLEQPFVKNDKISVQDHLNAAIAAIGENVIIRRFVRYQLGEEL